MKVYVVLESTTYEFYGVYATREQAQKRINEIIEEIPKQKDNLYIEECKISK